MAEGAVPGNGVPSEAVQGKVGKVCQQFLVHEDAGVAYRMQNEEFDYKYGLNRYNRRTAREDHPVARIVQTEEEERQQKERMEFLMRQKQLADQDEQLAKEMEEQLRMQEQEAGIVKEAEDAELAKKLQEREQKRYERKMREYELAKERKRIEKELAAQTREAEKVLSGYQREHGSTEDLDQAPQGPVGVLRTDNRVEDVGDFSDFYIQPNDKMDPTQRQELQRLQDEELARLLQDQEHKRGARVNQNKLREIEQQDAELARIIQEQEKLKAKKHRHRHRQMSQQESSTQNPGPPLPSRSRSTPTNAQVRGPVFYTAGDELSTRPENRRQLAAGESRISDERSRSPERSRSLESHEPASPAPPGYETRRPDGPVVQRPQQIEPRSHPQSPQSSLQSPLGALHHSNNSLPSPAGAVHHSNNSLPSPAGPVHHSNNILTAIDPTYRGDRHMAPPPASLPSPPQPSPSDFTTIDSARRVSPAGSAVSQEDPYCNLDDFAPVPGQKRSTLRNNSKKKDKKDKGCKQQ